MKVYIVRGGFLFEGYTNLKVFTDKQKAIAYEHMLSSNHTSTREYSFFDTEEFEVED